MTLSVHHRIKMLIEETNDAFVHCESHMNSDYAAFATLALSEFKHVLHKPDLTGQELEHILRAASAKHKDVDPDCCWATFMAHYVARSSNATSILGRDTSYISPAIYTEAEEGKAVA